MFGTYTGKIVACVDSRTGKNKEGREYESREYLFEVGGMRPYKFVFRLFKWLDEGDIEWPVVDERADITCVCMAVQSKDGKFWNQVNCQDYKKH